MDYALYAAHIAFWASFGITRWIATRNEAPVRAPAQPSAPRRTAPYSRALVAIHMVAFFIMYLGINEAVLGHQVPVRFPLQALAGAIVIAAGAALACWSVVVFRSWRFRAQLDSDHELATGGPFAVIRHPIYAGLDLLAVGSALWVPTPLLAAATVMMIIGSDLRGRAEEKLLLEAFGEKYRDYSRRTWRFLPWLY